MRGIDFVENRVYIKISLEATVCIKSIDSTCIINELKLEEGSFT